jgi:maltose 6'-phosphate phosphatase
VNKLSLITINLHCLEEENIVENQRIIVEKIIQKDADVVFLQEVAQYAELPIVIDEIKESNYGYDLQQLLLKQGYSYDYTYAPIKFSFNKYDEGLGILSKHPLKDVESKYISNIQDYSNWKSRKYVKATIRPFQKDIDLITVHLGWDSETESYVEQCTKMTQAITNKSTIIGGDFNVAYGTDYYKKTVAHGLVDLYGLDLNKKDDVTFENILDIHKKSARIDYIFATKEYKVIEQEIIFKAPKVSDHFGIHMKIEVEA